ncbi:L-lactate permease [Denitromonas sp.]|uniref:L-lactate permease n=1 Tax=Denitromonas sp. TaxID=2734609 RepID=UPI002AFF9A8F|nr:L-lactate permease [Denitromonas sp.]
MTLIYLMPLLSVAAWLLIRKGSLLSAGTVGLAVSIPCAAMALPEQYRLVAFLGTEVSRGVWTAWQAVSVILAGLFFYSVVQSTPAPEGTGGADVAPTATHRRLFAICFLLGPFFETVVGFGMGAVITLPLLIRQGLPPVSAVVFSLFSQMLVPWGALGVGTIVGAQLAGIELHQMGEGSALYSAPVLLGYLVVFWLFIRREGISIKLSDCIDDLLWTLSLVTLLYLSNKHIAVETALLTASGILLIVRHWRDQKPSAASWLSAGRQAAPYVLLALVLLLTRTIPWLSDFLRSHAIIRPAPGYPEFPVLYHVSFWILVVACLYASFAWSGMADRTLIISRTWARAKMPVAVTVVFVVLAQLMAASGMAAALAQQWMALLGNASIVGSPVFGAVAGFLTSSNVGSNAMVMPIQKSIAEFGGYSASAIAALQNTAGSNFTMLSAARVAMGCALAGTAGRELAVYGKAYPLGVASLSVLVLTTLAI